jgi:cytochrome b subunit of formate dehydrogenase
MADIVARDDLSAGPAAKPRSAGRSKRAASTTQPPRTDVGTLLLHWLTAVAFVVSLFTGIRIAADALHAPVSKWLSPILPQGQIWTFHFYAGLTLFFCAAAYFIYMRRASLFSRNAFKKTRVMVMK